MNEFTTFPCCSRLMPIFAKNNGRCHLFQGKTFNQRQVNMGLSVVMKMNSNIGIPHTNRPGTAIGASVRIQYEYDPIDIQQVFIPPGHIITISLQVRFENYALCNYMVMHQFLKISLEYKVYAGPLTA